MLQKFIWWTGLSDFLVGAGTWAGAVAIASAQALKCDVGLATGLHDAPRR